MEFIMNKWMITGFIMIFTTCLFANEEDIKKNSNGYSDPVELLKSFISPLKNGISGLDEANQATKSILSPNSNNNYAAQQMAKQGSPKQNGLDHSDVMETLKKDMGDKGVLSNVKLIQKDDSKLNGHVQKFKYQLNFSNGKKRVIDFTLLKPTINGGYFMTDISVEED